MSTAQEVVSEERVVDEGLKDAVHEARVAHVDQPAQTCSSITVLSPHDFPLYEQLQTAHRYDHMYTERERERAMRYRSDGRGRCSGGRTCGRAGSRCPGTASAVDGFVGSCVPL
jgi:hypothetical protein